MTMANEKKIAGVEGDVEKGRQQTPLAAPVSTANKMFPVPKYVFTIYSPHVLIIDEGEKETAENVDKQNLAKSVWRDYATMVKSSSNSSKKAKKLKVKLNSLIVKMLNRLIRDSILPREAVQFVQGPSYILFQILVSPSALPMLVSRCEYIGVGNVVGMVYASPIETSNVPPPGTNCKEIDLKLLLESSTGLGGSRTEEATPAKETTVDAAIDGADEDADTVSSVEEEEEGGTKRTATTSSSTHSPPSIVTIPMVSPQRAKKLREQILQARQEWLQTASRVRVEQVVEEVTAGAAFTIDYVAFVICAATIAAVGLATNSSVTTLASMLVSPIMGPVMGFTFGTTIRRKSLIRTSLRNELMSLLICIAIGAFWGIIAGVAGVAGRRDWPSSEMTGRGDVTGLVSGVIIAIPSGVATALSTLGRNSSGLVGVAISLSLLPPAVNCGMCWTYAALLRTPSVNRNAGDDTDYFQTGGISLALTVVNIICLWLAGVFTFWLKEVSAVGKKNPFWSRDMKLYRLQGDGKPVVNMEAINEGIQAAAELQEAEGIDIYKNDFDYRLSKKEVVDARRRGLAANAWEDALFLDNDFGLHGKVVVGGAADEVLDEEQLENAAGSASILQNAKPFGGLDEAGEALFDDALFADTSVSSDMLPSDVGVVHKDVAKQLLLRLSKKKNN